jgi:hypothetical protein
MKRYSGWEWLLIDAATQYGKDKLTFEERIKWTQEHLIELEYIAPSADNYPLFIKAVMAIRKAQKGLPTGHMVGVDGCCSGIQVMSVLTGCIAGATATGLVDPHVRADAYTSVTNEMQNLLGGAVSVSRNDAKQAVMTSFYGSKAKPKEIFGIDTPELAAFYHAAHTVAPGAWELLQDLLKSWQPYALQHCWILPDGYDARVKVMSKKEARIKVDELGSATFTYEFYENAGKKTGLSNVANVTHSMDAYILRSMHRRCNYDKPMVQHASVLLEMELVERLCGMAFEVARPEGKAGYYVDQYNRCKVVDITILPYLDAENVQMLETSHLQGLSRIVNGMLQYEPFELVTVHDEFKCHPNNVDHVRYQYKEILADIADSNVLDDILTQIYGIKGTFQKLSTNLGDLIRESNYGLC